MVSNEVMRQVDVFGIFFDRWHVFGTVKIRINNFRQRKYHNDKEMFLALFFDNEQLLRPFWQYWTFLNHFWMKRTCSIKTCVITYVLFYVIYFIIISSFYNLSMTAIKVYKFILYFVYEVRQWCFYEGFLFVA